MLGFFATAVLVIIVWRVLFKRSFNVKFDNAIQAINTGGELLLIGTLADTVKGPRKSFHVNREVAVSISAQGITIFDGWGGFNQDGFTNKITLSEKLIKNIVWDLEEEDKLYIGIQTVKSMPELNTKDKKNFRLLLSPYNADGDIDLAINILSSFSNGHVTIADE